MEVRMKRLALAAALVTSMVGAAQAQSPGTGAPSGQEVQVGRLGAEGVLVAPQGDWGESADLGFGVMGRVDIPVAAKLAIGVHPGLVFHRSKVMNGGSAYRTTSSNREILLLAGPRYYLAPEFSVSLETGLARLQTTTEGYDASGSYEASRIALSTSASYSTKGGFTVSAGVLSPNLLLKEGSETVQLGFIASLGYTIGM
jgi:hypothetical protein